jgi:hypothetical protein
MNGWLSCGEAAMQRRMYPQFTKNSRSLRLSTLSGRWYRSRIAEYADPGYGENAGTSDQENPG